MQPYNYRLTFDFDSQPKNTPVVAYNRIKCQWVETTLGDVQAYEPFSHFYFQDDETESASAVTPEEDLLIKVDSYCSEIRGTLNEMLEWIYKWSVSSPAVKETLDGFSAKINESVNNLEDIVQSNVK